MTSPSAPTPPSPSRRSPGADRRSLPDWAPHPLLVRAAATAACIVVIGAATWMVVAVLDLLALVLFPLVITLFVSRILAPPAAWMRERGLSPGAAAGATLGGALLLLAGMVALIAPPLVEEFRDLGPTLDEGISEIEDWLVEESSFDVSRADVEDAKEAATEKARDALENSQDQVARGARLTVAGAAGLILALVLSLFVLKDGERFVTWVDGHVPPRRRPEVRVAARASWRALGGYLRGAAILGVVEAVVIGAAMALTGTGLVIPVMLLTFAAAFVPIVGAIVAGVIAVLVTLAAGGLVPALIVAVVVIVVQQLDSDLLAPWIYGKALELHPVAVLLAITTGTALFGFAGTVLAVPATAAAVTSVLAVRALSDPDEDDPTAAAAETDDPGEPPGARA